MYFFSLTPGLCERVGEVFAYACKKKKESAPKNLQHQTML
jgi:hypothetical protein